MKKSTLLHSALGLTLLVSVIGPHVTYANVNANGEEEYIENTKESVSSMKKRLQDQEKNLKRLQFDVKDVEYSLVMNTKKYQKLVEERSKIESQLQEAKKNLDLESEGLKRSFQQTKNILGGVILHRLDKNEKSSDLLSKKLLVEMLQKRLVDLSDLIRNNNNMKSELARMDAEYQQSLSTEKELIQIVQEMEAKKQELLEVERIESDKKISLEKQYNDARNRVSIERNAENRKKLKEKLQNVQLTEEIKVADTIQKNSTKEEVGLPGSLYQTPLKSFQDFSYQKKGITYKFSGKNEIRAPRSGNVIYTGVLSTFGNILMIDHGDNTRSVLLGHFDYYVKNGDKLDLGSVIGHTKATNVNPDSDGKLYYEIRKNNLAQNTYQLIDKKSLSKNFLR
ncbi:MAG: peptidoglycan DD-metalloendopeptidase family protein [Bacteriovoracaceae bacterium]|nr:peptidoglycan DD-metalloendopeptidase family protein [Bacteriovoracaceae bacterium]